MNIFSIEFALLLHLVHGMRFDDRDCGARLLGVNRDLTNCGNDYLECLHTVTSKYAKVKKISPGVKEYLTRSIYVLFSSKTDVVFATRNDEICRKRHANLVSGLLFANDDHIKSIEFVILDDNPDLDYSCLQFAYADWVDPNCKRLDIDNYITFTCTNMGIYGIFKSKKIVPETTTVKTKRPEYKIPTSESIGFQIDKILYSVKHCKTGRCLEDYSRSIFRRMINYGFFMTSINASMGMNLTLSGFEDNSNLVLANLAIYDPTVYASVIYCEIRDSQNLKKNATMALEVNARPGDKYLCVYYDVGSHMWWSNGCVTVATNTTVYCSCDHLSIFAILLNPGTSMSMLSRAQQNQLSLISKIGLLASAVAEYLAVGLIFLYWKNAKKSLTQMYFLQLCLCLYMLNFAFIGASYTASNRLNCKINGLVLHYFLLASFFWMCANAAYHYAIMVKVLGVQLKVVKIIIPTISWLLPFLFIGVSFLIDPNSYSHKSQLCWVTGKALYSTVYFPLITVLLVNAYTYVKIYNSFHLHTSFYNKDKIKILFMVFMTFGFTWIFGFFTLISSSPVFVYLFCIFNTFQGLFVIVLRSIDDPFLRQIFVKIRN